MSPKPRLSITPSGGCSGGRARTAPPVSDMRICEAALLLARHSRKASSDSFGPEQIALPLGHLGKPPAGAAVHRNRCASPGVITASGLLDGTANLVEASQRAREFADWLRALADAGCELESPFPEGCGVYGARGPAAPGPA
jgi:hypothetical protein